MAFHQVDIPREAQVGLIMSAEVDELGGVAGPQDRVIQVYEGLVYMDFAREVGGRYESLDPGLLPPFYLAYWPEGAEASQRVHGDLRARWESGEPGVGEALDQIAALAARGREALLAGDHEAIANLMNENFDLRRGIMDVAERDIALVERARSMGASAKLPGSGGAIVGTCADAAMRQEVGAALGEMGAVVVEPRVLPGGSDA
jgi:glucuronokinase